MHEVGFEPTKRFASDLKSDPFDQTRVPMLILLDIVITVKIYKNKVTVILVLIYTITIRYFFLPDYLR